MPADMSQELYYAVGFISGIITALVLAVVHDYITKISPKNKELLTKEQYYER